MEIITVLFKVLFWVLMISILCSLFASIILIKEEVFEQKIKLSFFLKKMFSYFFQFLVIINTMGCFLISLLYVFFLVSLILVKIFKINDKNHFNSGFLFLFFFLILGLIEVKYKLMNKFWNFLCRIVKLEILKKDIK